MADQPEGSAGKSADSEASTSSAEAFGSGSGRSADAPVWTGDLIARFDITNITSLASAILERAASLDPPSPDEGEISSTRLYVAIVEAFEQLEGSFADDGFIIAALARLQAQEGRFGGMRNVVDKYMSGVRARRTGIRRVGLTPNMEAVIRAALANDPVDTGQHGTLSADALAVALLHRRGTNLETRFRAQEMTLSDIRAGVLEEVLRLDPSRSELWRGALQGRVVPSELSGFTSDRVDTARSDGDPLRLLADVTAFARLICLEEAEPPLSIGLFGGWGSGKSTFMQLLEREVDALTKRARRSAKERPEPALEAAPPAGPSFIQNVVQVRFNAWHFADANLWASLTAEFFDQLRAGGYAGSGKAIHARLVERVNQHVHALTSEAATAREALAASEATMREAQTKRDQAMAKAENAPGAAFRQTAVDAVTRSLEQHKGDMKELGRKPHLNDPAKDVEDFVELAKQVRTAGGQLAALVSFVLARGWRAAFAAAGLAAVAAGIGLTASTGAFRLNGVDVLAYAAGIVALARAVLPGVRIIAGVIDSTASFAANLDGRLEEEIKNVAEAEEALKRATVETEARRAAAERASKALARYIDPSPNIANPPRLLRYMLEDDPDTRALEKEIGLISRVRRLFQAVDEIVREERGKGGVGEDTDVPDRIIIYIDDLDRCTPAQVYAVLQAIHLLLAFQLFVVVVGVDVGWVQEALAHELRPTVKDTLSGIKGEETEIDERKLAIRYLQKIFQLPFWLRPLSTDGSDGGSYARYVRSLLARNLAAQGPGPLAGMAARVSAGPPDEAAPALESASREGEPGREPQDESALAEALATVRLTQAEVDFLASQAIGRLAGNEPRAVKRFANIYRLIRARLNGDERSLLLGEEGGSPPEYPIVVILIAIEVGQPLEIADAFYARLVSATGSSLDLQDIDDRIVSALAAAEKLRDGAKISRADCERWARTARRYSFNKYVLDTVHVRAAADLQAAPGD